MDRQIKLPTIKHEPKTLARHGASNCTRGPTSTKEYSCHFSFPTVLHKICAHFCYVYDPTPPQIIIKFQCCRPHGSLLSPGQVSCTHPLKMKYCYDQEMVPIPIKQASLFLYLCKITFLNSVCQICPSLYISSSLLMDCVYRAKAVNDKLSDLMRCDRCRTVIIKPC